MSGETGDKGGEVDAAAVRARAIYDAAIARYQTEFDEVRRAAGDPQSNLEDPIRVGYISFLTHLYPHLAKQVPADDLLREFRNAVVLALSRCTTEQPAVIDINGYAKYDSGRTSNPRHITTSVEGTVFITRFGLKDGNPLTVTETARSLEKDTSRVDSCLVIGAERLRAFLRTSNDPVVEGFRSVLPPPPLRR